MANLCNFIMKIKGNRENIEMFLDALLHKGDIYIGSGAHLEGLEYDDEDDSAVIWAYCKRSIINALRNDAIYVRNAEINPHRKERRVTLEEACKIFDVMAETYSEEPFEGFAEHYLITPQEGVEISEEREYREYPIGEYKRNNMTKEDAERELGITISKEDWEGPDDFLIVGGFYAEFGI